MAEIPFERHVFVCINERPAGHARGDCASKGATDLHGRLKALCTQAGLGGRVRINKAGCLDTCECGVSMVVYPDAVWYGFVSDDDLEEIVRSHLVGGKAVERLRIPR
ncbi:MAG: (2Fe-2S) ferredoxin domain-containing protein [Planctomycetes bacterium]|nr:(2Fe-2S) ferredoxin domain-containing protein [Planctomycetota bacterium]